MSNYYIFNLLDYSVIILLIHCDFENHP